MAKLLINYPLYEDNKWVSSTTYNTSSTSQQVTTTEADGKKISSVKPINFSNYYDQLKSLFGPGAYQTVQISEDLKLTVVSPSSLPQKHRSKGGYNTFFIRSADADNPRNISSNGLIKNGNGYCLPNCTAGVQARVIELMIVSGLAKGSTNHGYDGSQSSSTGSDITESPSNKYSIYDLSNLTNCGNANQFYKLGPWCTRAGGSSDGSPFGACAYLRNYCGGGVGDKARAGSIISGKSDPTLPGYDPGEPGHVAFVEQVVNEGTEDEYIIITESGGSGTNNLVAVSKCYKKDNGNRYDLKFQGFCYSPLCDLIQAYPTSTGGIGIAPGTVTIDINEPDQSVGDQYYADVEKQKEFAAYGTNGEKLENLKKNDKVEVQWLGGNEKLDGTGKPLNKMGLQAIIKKNGGQEYKYQYEVGLKNGTKVDTVGFFDRGSLKKLP